MSNVCQPVEALCAFSRAFAKSGAQGTERGGITHISRGMRGGRWVSREDRRPLAERQIESRDCLTPTPRSLLALLRVLALHSACENDPIGACSVEGGLEANPQMGIALARLIHSSHTPDDGGPQFDPNHPQPNTWHSEWSPTPNRSPSQSSTGTRSLSSVRIEITNDGSVVVVGIPNAVPREYGQIIARIATDAALKHWRRTRTSRPCPSRDDRRLFTKAAKGAVRAYGKDQAA